MHSHFRHTALPQTTTSWLAEQGHDLTHDRSLPVPVSLTACAHFAARLVAFFYRTRFIICPIATAYSMGQIIKSVCVCLCVCLSVRLRALSRSHFFIDFHQSWHRRKNPKSKNEFVGGQYRLPLFCPSPQTPILGQEVLKTHANIK